MWKVPAGLCLNSWLPAGGNTTLEDYGDWEVRPHGKEQDSG